MAQPGSSGADAVGGERGMTSELESFRQQWRAEVQAKASLGTGTEYGGWQQSKEKKEKQQVPVFGETTAVARTGPSTEQKGAPLPAPETPMKGTLLSAGKKPAPLDGIDGGDRDDGGSGSDDDDYYVRRHSFGDAADGQHGAADRTAETSTAGSAYMNHAPPDEPRSALEHYEKAAEREAQGNLGDSVRLYRQAFRMDSAVDKKYKNKHFPVAGKQPATASTAATAATAVTAATTAAPTATTATPSPPPPLKDLIASFAGLAIEATPPPVEGDPPPPCPLAALPDELLVHVLRDVAVADVGDYVRLAQVCKKLAYLVATEDRIWRRVCVGGEFGFANMHRTWQRSIAWRGMEGGEEGIRQQFVDADAEAAASLAMTLALRGGRGGSPSCTSAGVYPSWQHMFRQRPRLRFNGCYISTVNYVRPGQASANMVTWNNPVLIVTYFRYLRFFRDGTAISLVTTAEPVDVVHHLTKDLLALHHGGGQPSLPSAVMQSAWKGRWRLSGGEAGGETTTPAVAVATRTTPTHTAPTRTAPAAPPSPLTAAIEAEADLVVETEGVGKYYYRLELSLRSAGKGARNNKLVWRGFYSYDRLTDDWGEFGLKNDRPFFFSRVKSYGMGE